MEDYKKIIIIILSLCHDGPLVTLMMHDFIGKNIVRRGRRKSKLHWVNVGSGIVEEER